MHIIFLNNKKGTSRTVSLNFLLIGIFTLIIICGAATAGAYYGSNLFPNKNFRVLNTNSLQNELKIQQEEITKIKLEAERQMEAFSKNLGLVQSRLTRIDALGDRLVDLAELEGDEFDFSSKIIGQGGGENTHENSETLYKTPDFLELLEKLQDEIIEKEKKLEFLQKAIGEQRLNEAGYLYGYPVRYGYVSSKYGKRIHPITGKVANHAGVDFASHCGNDVIAIAQGIVTFAGIRGGYGNVIEISHSEKGSIYKTLYAHNSKLLANAGQLVSRNEVIALVGSTGNSTGCHVHFEVTKDGILQDPMNYISRSKDALTKEI